MQRREIADTSRGIAAASSDARVASCVAVIASRDVARRSREAAFSDGDMSRGGAEVATRCAALAVTADHACASSRRSLAPSRQLAGTIGDVFFY